MNQCQGCLFTKFNFFCPFWFVLSALIVLTNFEPISNAYTINNTVCNKEGEIQWFFPHYRSRCPSRKSHIFENASFFIFPTPKFFFFLALLHFPPFFVGFSTNFLIWNEDLHFVYKVWNHRTKDITTYLCFFTITLLFAFSFAFFAKSKNKPSTWTPSNSS